MHACFSFGGARGSVLRAAGPAVAGLLASVLLSAGPRTAHAQVDLSHPDYHFKYVGQATMSFSGATYVTKDDAWYTSGTSTYTATWLAEGDGWASSDQGVNQLPLKTLNGSISIDGKPDPIGIANPQDNCMSKLIQASDTKLHFDYFPAGTARPLFPDDASGPPPEPSLGPYMEIAFPFEEPHLIVVDNTGAQTCKIIDNFHPFRPNEYPALPLYPIAKRHDWGQAYFARADLLAPTDIHPAEFTRSFDFDYPGDDKDNPGNFYPAFDRYPAYGKFELHIHSSIDIRELE